MGLASMAFYIAFAYDLERTNFLKLITLYGALFYLFHTLVKIEKTNLPLLTILAVFFRLLFLIATPNLSQDFYRFIWDGRMLYEGFNPYLYLPANLIEQNIAPVAQAHILFEGMGDLSAGHYTNYPPVNQLLFLIAALFTNDHILGAIIVLRTIIILADIGILFFGTRLLKQLKIPSYYIFFYILNPFVIIELTGNLHFEGVMLFFLILSLYLLANNKWRTAAFSMALSISVKLLPLLILPLFLQKLRIKKAFFFYSLTLICTVAMFVPFFSYYFINSYSETLALWFTNFEFNGSFYIIIREIGYKVKGYNIINTVGKIIPVVVVAVIIAITFFRKNSTMPQLISGMLLALSFYFFTASVVHPWYISTLVLLSVFTTYRFPLLWSLTIMLSYFTYAQPNFRENYFVQTLQYLPVLTLCLYEIFSKDKKISISTEKI